MPKVSFSKDERAKANEENHVLVSFAVDGEECEGFPYKQYATGLTVSPQLAEEAVKWFAEWLARARDVDAVHEA